MQKKEYAVDDSLVFDSRDYGGLIKSPVGNGFSDKFVLLSILGQINFLIYGVDKWIKEDIPAKLRFAYLLYFYLLKVIPQINIKLNTHFTLEEKWCDGGFRNAMAHYKLGVVLRKEDIFYEDIMFGLTCHFFNEGYTVVKESIYSMLEELAIQIGCYLNLQKGFISTKL